MKNKKLVAIISTTIGIIFILFSCTNIPKKASVINNFESQRYLGKWYEVARLDNVFEKNMNNVTAEYSLNKDSTIRVTNRGYNYVKNKWEQADGKAKYRERSIDGALKVSFFEPFYSGYNIVSIDKDYKYALIAGRNLNYLWILSRKTSVPDFMRKEFLNKASGIGYDTTALIWVEHSK